MQWSKLSIRKGIKVNRLRQFGHIQRMEKNRIPQKIIKYYFVNKKPVWQTEKYMVRRSWEGWKTSCWNLVEGNSTQQRAMEEAAENRKESQLSAHANG